MKRQRYANLEKLNKDNFAKKFFGPWLALTRHRVQRRQDFYRLRACNINRRAFNALKQNLIQSNGLRVRAKRLLRSRAKKLISKVFY